MVENYKILVSDNCSAEGLATFENFPNISYDVKTGLSVDELKSIIPEYHGLIVRSATKVTKEIISVASNLKVIARAGAGFNNIDVEACTDKGIAVLITPSGNTNAVVEITMGLMLGFVRNIPKAYSTMKEGKWAKKKLSGTEIKGKTLGLLGIGRIGSGVAKRSQTFGMKVIAFDKFVSKEYADEIGVELFEDLNEFLKQVDFLSLHVPVNDSTRGMIGSKQFEIMKKSAIIINCARGAVINEKELYLALKEDKIRGACIDVYSKEPASIDEFPFITLDNVICTPHLGASTHEAQVNVAALAAEQIGKLLNEGIFIDCVNKKDLSA